MDTATDYLVSVEAGEVYELSYQVRIHGEKSVVTPYLYYYTEEGGAASIPYTSANAVASGKGGLDEEEREAYHASGCCEDWTELRLASENRRRKQSDSRY